MDIDKTRALDLAISFVDDHWKSLTEDDLSISVLSGGFSGRLYIVEDISKTSNINPNRKFLVRLYGGKLMDTDDIAKAGKCEAAEGIVCYANAIQGLGPKLFGVFDGGRVEEFVPSHQLTETDLADENMSLELIRKLARFHALQLPISKKKRDLLSITATYLIEYNKEKMLKLVERLGLNADEYSYMDKEFDAERVFLSSFESQVGGRLVLCHNDLNKNNILVRDTPDQFNEHVILIDYEVAATDYRGCDLGLLLFLKMIETTDEGIVQIVCGWPDESYRRMIITEYLKETRKLNYFDFDEHGLDSVEHVIMEIDFFVMYGMQFFMGTFKKIANKEFFQQQSDKTLKSLFEFMVEVSKMYPIHKKHFIDKYSKALEQKL